MRHLSPVGWAAAVVGAIVVVVVVAGGAISVCGVICVVAFIASSVMVSVSFPWPLSSRPPPLVGPISNRSLSVERFRCRPLLLARWPQPRASPFALPPPRPQSPWFIRPPSPEFMLSSAPNGAKPFSPFINGRPVLVLPSVGGSVWRPGWLGRANLLEKLASPRLEPLVSLYKDSLPVQGCCSLARLDMSKIFAQNSSLPLLAPTKRTREFRSHVARRAC